MGKKSSKKANDVDEAGGSKKKGQAIPPESKTRAVLGYVKSIAFALFFALLLKQFVFQAFRIPTGSMLETLQIGDFLFVNKFLYGAKTPDRIRIGSATLVDGLPVLRLPALRGPRQGDIIVFEYPKDRNLDYIKRCVAVAGDTVAVDAGVLRINGEIYESNFGDRDGDHSCVPNWTDPESCPAPRAKHDQASYVRNTRNHKWPWPGMPDPYVVPEGHIFMMGDNRYNSMDSRYWGPLDIKLIKGKAMFLYWSWNGEKHLPRINRIGDLIK
ncbi:MAG: signal peptidase I [Candidatus Krumholzibacteriia bacterium]|jgi:signal peptidase I